MTPRRRFILGTFAVGGALAVGWTVLPPRQRLRASAAPAAGALNGWVVIGTDDTVSVVMPKSEMGQGVHTGLAMVLADELDADWNRVRVVPAPIDAIYNNIATVVDGLPFHPDDEGGVKRLAGWLTAKTMREIGGMVTGGSSSLKDLWLPMREAGASARAMLIAAAARAWNLPAAEIAASGGTLTHASGRKARFGEFAAAAALQPAPERVVLKTAEQFKIVGQPAKRLEAAAKGSGQATFGIDVLQPGMLYASVVMCPTLGGTVTSFDAEKAMSMPGVRQVVAVRGFNGGTAGVAAIAESPWLAMQAAQQVAVVWDERVPASTFSSGEALERLSQLLTQQPDSGFAYYQHGDAAAALSTAAKTLSAEYRAPWLAHSTLEPQNCTARVSRNRAVIWAPTQVPDFARLAVAHALGLSTGQVELNVTLLGGGFGRRLDVDFIAQAAAIAAAVPDTPVQTFWSRSQDLQHDFYRPAAVAHFKAGFDAQGRLVAWHNVSAGQAVLSQVVQRLFGLPLGLPLDKTTSEGAYDQPYEWPNARIAHRIVDLPVPVGFWRSVGHSHQAFFKESFVDEAAHAVGQDPVAFRLALLQKHPRHRKVLERAAALSGWGQPAAPGRALGVALHQSFGTLVAQVAEVSVTPERQIRVHRVWCAVDCGTPVNPSLIRQQMESGIVFGLGAALHGEIEIVRGRVQATNFHEQKLLPINECPAITTEILPSTAAPEGVGEPGTPPIAPAVANALFALTGQRLRSLPLKLS